MNNTYEDYYISLLLWAYNKLYHFKVQDSSMENALKMDEINLILMGAYNEGTCVDSEHF